ncbi:acetyl-CoA carboxylase carboxyltransferase subunit alpha [Vampirovibrio chlorellavorus]|uniref:acetyl-CoA carboxylase carboxyltransferase subunit alpha n=1 Tax=Vampirovibrio chlorellavorus TaxID=758823 RepID=UPI0026EC7ADF|nr:acetyl-CoA carboxylase carboxyltransferase subunit alpha [Vampirovibrio chlorellavorus]
MSDKILPLEFEKPIMAMEEKIEELMRLSQDSKIDFSEEIDKLRAQADEVKSKLYQKLTPAQKLQIARHPQRPNLLETVKMLSPNMWIEMRGDRAGTDDRAIIGGIIELSSGPVMVVGTQKGRGMKENLTHNFGMANPEGYRKALRLFAHAEKFKMPVLTIIDTPGAYPGIDGEQHGIGQAIAYNIREMARLRTPIISVVSGEGASGGALGIGVANRIYMLEHALYTVISPEGCASILWRSAEYASKAAEALKITAQDLLAFDIVDGIIPEPQGGAHQEPATMAQRILETVESAIAELKGYDAEKLLVDRYDRFRKIGAFCEAKSPALKS